MRYALLICGDEKGMEARSPEEASTTLNEYLAFGEEMGKRGVLQGGERLRPTTMTSRVWPRRGTSANAPLPTRPKWRSRSSTTTRVGVSAPS